MAETTFTHVQVHLQKNVLVVTVNLDSIRGDDLAEALSKDVLAALDANPGMSRVVIDLGKVQYMSSVGFRPLLQVHKRVRDQQGRVALCCLSPLVSETLHVTRMIGGTGSVQALFEEYPTVEAAVTALASDV